MGDSNEFGFELIHTEENKTMVYYSVLDNRLVVDKSKAGNITSGVNSFEMHPDSNNCVKMRVLVDTSIINVFGNEGLANIITYYFPASTANELNLYSLNGDVHVNSIKVYELGSIY